MDIKDLKEVVAEAFLIALNESARPGQGRKRNRRFKKQVASNTITSDDGDHKIIGTHHYDQKDNEGLKKEKKNYSHQARKEVSAHIKKLRKAGKEVDLGVEGGSHKSPNKGHEKDIALKATKGKKGNKVHLKSNEDPNIKIPSGFMKNDADRTPEEMERIWPEDSDPEVGPPKPQNPDSKLMRRINKDRDQGYSNFAKTAASQKRGSAQLAGTGHTDNIRRKGFGEQIKNAVLNYLDEGTAEGVWKAAKERGYRDADDEKGETIIVGSKSDKARTTTVKRDSRTGKVVVDRYDRTNKPPRTTTDKLAKGEKLTPAEAATADRRRNRSVSDPKNKRTVEPDWDLSHLEDESA